MFWPYKNNTLTFLKVKFSKGIINIYYLYYYQVDGLGTWSNTAVYASLVVSCMFLPSFFIKTLTVKWTLPICMFCYTIYICTQFYPAFYTIIPGAIFVGIGAAPMWSAKCTYLTQVISKALWNIELLYLYAHSDKTNRNLIFDEYR